MEAISLTDAVVTDVPGPNKRVFAFLIDGITFSLIFAALSRVRPELGGLWEYALWSGFFLLRDIAGGSLGKRLTGLTIVTGTGQPASTSSLIFRNVPVVIPFVVIAEYFVMKGASDGKRWGDRWAGTRVQDLRPHVSDGRFLLYSIGVVVALVAMRAYAGTATVPDQQGEVADLQGRPIVSWIEQLADDSNSFEAEKVIRAAGTSATPALSNAVLTHANPKVRRDAARALGQTGGPNSVAVLVKALKDPDADVRTGAASGLFYRGIADDPETASAITALVAAIKDPELRVRLEVASALESIGPFAKDAVPALLAAAQNQEDEAWHFFADALREIDIVTARQTIPLVVSAYDREKNDKTRFLIIALLRELKGPPEAVAPTFIRALDDKYDYVRESAAGSLGEIGPPAAAAIPKLTRLLKDEDEDTREAAAESLKLIQGK
jgi:HEAT repeat protein/uncharacterized RDD family membrane protein YckC